MIITCDNIGNNLVALRAALTEAENEACNALRTYQPMLSNQRWVGSDLYTLINNSLFTFDFLPREACPILVLITDGVVTLSEAKTDIFLKLNANDVGLCVLSVSSSNRDNCLFGYIPNFGT